jgi:TonB family protein
MVSADPELHSDTSQGTNAAVELLAHTAESEDSGQTPKSPKRRVPTWILALGAVLAAAALSMAFWPSLRHPVAPAPASLARIEPLTFRVRMEQHGKDVALTWNPDANAVRGATTASLFIRDGERQETVALNPSVLQTGLIHYRPLTGRLEFRLMLQGGSGPITMAEGSIDQPTPADSPVLESQAASTSPVEGLPSEQPEVATPAHAGFTPPATHVRESEILEAPDLGANGSVPQLPVDLPSRQLQPAPPPEPHPAAPARESTSEERTAAPVLLYQIRPHYPEFAIQHHVQGAVHVKIAIDVGGRVQQAEVLDGSPVLRQAALDAVRQWVYKPALLDGKPVPFDLKATVNFSGGGAGN